MPSRPPMMQEPRDPIRPPLSPSLAYESFNPESTPPTISAFVAEAVVYLSNATVSETTIPPADAPSGERDTAPVINAVVRLLDTMTATRFSRIQNLIADQELSASSIGTDDLGDSLLDDFDLAFQIPDPEAGDVASRAILSDGSIVNFDKPKIGHGMQTASTTSAMSSLQDSISAVSPPSRDESFWKKLLNLGGPRDTQPVDNRLQNPSSNTAFFNTAAKRINCASIPSETKDQELGTGLMQIKSDRIVSVQGYTWSSLEDYQNDKAQRTKHLRRKLMGTRQFLERKSGRMLRQVVTGGTNNEIRASDLDVRRQKRRIWLKLHGVSPAPELLAKLKFFHSRANPVYDHFQLKNLLCLRSDKEVFYLSHEQHGDRQYTCVMSYNLQTHTSQRSLGPWSFNSARPLSHNSRPIYHSLASISFESRYLFSLAVSENYVATSDTSSSILLSKRPRQKTESGGAGTFSEAPVCRPMMQATGSGDDCPIAGHRILCQRVSSQPLQIINSIQLIEFAETSRVFNDWSQPNTISNDLLSIIWKQAQEKSQRIFCAACSSLEHLCGGVKARVALGQAWQILKREQTSDSRSLRRLRTLFTPSASAFMRASINIFTPEEPNSHESSPENHSDHLPSPTSLIVLTAGNDKTLCEYSLAAQVCHESTHILLNNGDSICKLRSSGVNGFSACVGQRNARYKNVLKLTRSWQFPFCINRIAVHPDKNLLLLVGDNPSVMITARSAPNDYYLGRHGSIKNSIFTIDFHQDASFAAAWHPNGIMFATGSDDRTVAIWDLRQLMAPLHVLRTEVTACRNLEFSPDGRFLLSCESEDAVVLYSVTDDFAVAQKIPFFGACTGAAFSSDSERIILGIGPPGGLMELVISRLPAAAATCNRDLLVS